MTHTTFDALAVQTAVPRLEFRFRIDAETAANIPIDDSAAGQLGFIPIIGGTVTGAVHGTVTSGGDWCLRKDPVSYRVEARYGLRTEAGAYLDVHNVGILNEATAVAAEYFMTTPVIKTADPELDWLNRAVFIGHATVLEGSTRIDVFEVVLPQLSTTSGPALP